jgi:hypothetical protein
MNGTTAGDAQATSEHEMEKLKEVKRHSKRDALLKRLKKVEEELDKNRTSSYVDGFGSSRYAKKSRKWDYYAQEKFNILKELDEMETTV